MNKDKISPEAKLLITLAKSFFDYYFKEENNNTNINNSKDKNTNNKDNNENNENKDNNECCICFMNIDKKITLDCGHTKFHKECILNMEHKRCPLCNIPYKKIIDLFI